MPHPSASASPIHFMEDSARLISVLKELGLGAMSLTEQQQFLEVFPRGLRLLSSHEPYAADWSAAIAQIAITQLDKEQVQLEAATAELSVLSRTILDQPASFIPPRQQDDCLAYACKVALAICLKLIQAESKRTCHGIKQLFKSGTTDWARVRGPQLHVDLVTAIDKDGFKQVVQDFINETERFKRVSIPPISSFLTRTDSKYVPTSPTAVGTTEHPLEATSAKPKNTTKPPDDLAPDYHLFEAQIFRSIHPDVSDGHRLPNNWNRQSTRELNPTVQRLRDQLKQQGGEHRPTRLHAAARFISMLAGLSLKTCFTMPIAWGDGRKCQGTMHLDLNKGVLRRDALCVAMRKKRQGKLRLNGRWWRIRVPPEILTVLVEVMQLLPGARTLGDLLHAAGLDHESCQHLLNDGSPTSHKPEDARFANSFRSVLLDLGVHPALVARVTGDISTTPFADHFYLSFSEFQVHEVTAQFCNWAGLEPPPKPARDRIIGSPKRLSLEDFQSIVQHLNQLVLSVKNQVTPRSNIKTVVDFHNLYTRAFVIQLIFAHGGRGNLIGRMTFERIFSSQDYIALSDRRVDRYSRQRICPLTSMMSEGNGHYLEHVKAFSGRLKSHSASNSSQIEKISRGQVLHRTPFFIFKETSDGWSRRELRRDDLVSLLKEIGLKIRKTFDWEDLNVARHFWHTELVNQQISQPAIEAFLGHHTVGVEVFGYGSGVSIREVCDHLRPTVLSIQNNLGFKPLVGLGRTAKRYLGLPDIEPQNNLRALPSKLLLQKLAQQDLVIREVTIREQDPPTTSKTLVTHTAVETLKKRYLQSSLVSSHSIGAAMFCLVTFELVLSEAEQDALFTAAMADGLWRIGRMCVVEAEHKSRPIAQRILQEHSQAAIFKAREQHRHLFATKVDANPFAVDELHKFLVALAPAWPCKTAPESRKLLSLMASHWAAIEIAPGTLFGVFHKAPLVPVIDLARTFYKQPRAQTEKATKELDSTRGSHKPKFKATDEILRTWANKDVPLGEQNSRAHGCSTALSRYLSRTDLNLAERMHAELLVADLSKTPPYKTLDASTLPSYSNKYQRFFQIAQDEESCDLEPEHFIQAFKDMGGGESMSESALPRWAMLHICAFLSSRGHWVPAALTDTAATKTPRPPRIPVYTSTREIELVGSDLNQHFSNCGGTYSFAGARLKLERHAPLRAAELRYSRPCDYDLENDLLHVTTSGHDHLKTIGSRGSIPLTKDISAGLANLKRLRQEIDAGYDTLMLADAHLSGSYRSFDEVTSAIRKFAVFRTACPEFRRHDFRAAASTDVCFPVEPEIERLASGASVTQNCATWTASELNERSTRFAKAARFSRHAAIATTLRFYNCSGPLDLHQQLELSASGLPVSGIYAAEVLGISADYLYVMKDRRDELNTATPGSTPANYKVFVMEWLHGFRSQLNVPPLAGPSNRTDMATQRKREEPSASQIIHACLLACTGLGIEVAAGALNLPLERIQVVHRRTMKIIESHFISSEHKDSVSVLSSHLDPKVEPLPLGASIKSLSRWLTSPKCAASNWGLVLKLAMGGNTSTLTVADYSHLEHLLPILKGVSHHGFRVLLRPATGVVVSSHPSLSKRLKAARVEVCSSRGKSAGFGVIQFCVRPGGISGEGAGLPTPEEISPRSVGMAGRVVVLGLVVAAFTDFLT